MNWLEAIRNVRRSGVLIQSFIMVLFNGVGRKSQELIFLLSQFKKQEKYRRLIDDSMFTAADDKVPVEVHQTIWVCWLQGIDVAPPIVQTCIARMRKVKGFDVILIDETNFRLYTDFPEYIIDKWNSGQIPAAHFSDLLRVELLIRHGGVWLDSTVYLSDDDLPDFIKKSWFFCYQVFKPGLHGCSITVSSWALSACKNNALLITVRTSLYRYWECHNKLEEYFLFHHFLSGALALREDWRTAILPACNSTPHFLQERLGQPFDAVVFRHICEQSRLHKLTHKISVNSTHGSFHDKILERSGDE